jgi:hypothetical protein
VLTILLEESVVSAVSRPTQRKERKKKGKKERRNPRNEIPHKQLRSEITTKMELSAKYQLNLAR